MHLARYPGLDLPVYESDTVIAWTTEEIDAASQIEAAGHFIRRAALIDIGDKGHRLGDISLNKILDLADKAIDHVCEYVGHNATPVQHEWGLYRGSMPSTLPLDYKLSYNSGDHPSIPKGYHLIAKVERVLAATPIYYDTALGSVMYNSLEEYEAQLFLKPSARTIDFPQFVNFDTGLHQFVFDQRHNPIFVDIEPRIGDVDSLWRRP